MRVFGVVYSNKYFGLKLFILFILFAYFFMFRAPLHHMNFTGFL